MKVILISLCFFFFISGKLFSQSQYYLPGEYEICFDSAASDGLKDHCLYITLNDDYSYEIRFVDKKQADVSNGTWEYYDGAIIMTPAEKSEYPAIHKDLLDKLIPERRVYQRNESLIWEIRSEDELISRTLKKVRKCNC